MHVDRHIFAQAVDDFRSDLNRATIRAVAADGTVPPPSDELDEDLEPYATLVEAIAAEEADHYSDEQIAAICEATGRSVEDLVEDVRSITRAASRKEAQAMFSSAREEHQPEDESYEPYDERY